MKVALVHDYLNEFGGAERVLLALSEIWPEAPIYTAFYRQDSEAYKRFKNKTIIASWAQRAPFFKEGLYSPLRFLAPSIWNSFDFSDYDVVITSASWYITKGMKKGPKTVEICYCHTPPRWLYGYKTALEWQKYWPVKVYATVVGHFMRQYDFKQAQKLDYFVANSEEVKRRIGKFYRREAKIIYPPALKLRLAGPPIKKDNYYLIVARIVGSKGVKLGIEAAKKMNLKLKIVGEGPAKKQLQALGGPVEWLGWVKDKKLPELYAQAKAFLALSEDEDFGITPVEAMAAGTPVIAYNGGGYKESVAEGKTGVFFKDYSVKSLIQAIKELGKIKIRPENCIKQAQKFSKERFKKEMKKFVENKVRHA